MTNPIDEAIARSNAGAATAAAALPAVVTPGATAVGAPAASPVKLTMAQMMAGGMTVDKWIKVNEDGIKIGDSKLIVGGFDATIDMTEGSGFILKHGIKGGNPAQYAYTTDLATAVTGGSWEAAMARIRALDPKANPYRSVDLPFTLVGEVKDMAGAVVGKAGDTVGYTTSTTNWKNWETFFKAVAEAELLGQVVSVHLTAEAKTNKAGNNWGILKIELKSEAASE